MTKMDGKLLKPCCVDRLNNLPVELLSRILSMLPTKDAAAMQVLSKRMSQAFTSITSVDLDDSPVSRYLNGYHLLERSPLFESFVDKMLQKLSEFGRNLTRFRLCLGGDKTKQFHVLDKRYTRNMITYCSDLEPVRLSVLISYPLAHCGLRELDLSFHVDNLYNCELPLGLFTCTSLEVLRLDCNLEIDDGADIPLIRLPNLKLLHLRSLVFTEDDFVTRLVSSCPSLENLSITYCWWKILDHLTISSHSVRKLALNIWSYVLEDSEDEDEDEIEDGEGENYLVLIDTPSLQYLDYDDYLADHYSIAHINALVEAHIRIRIPLDAGAGTPGFLCQLSLIRALSNAQHLSLVGYCAETYVVVSDRLLSDLTYYDSVSSFAGWAMTNKDRKLLTPCCVDVLNNLPVELLSRILSMLPTKDAAAMQVLSKSMRRAFTGVTRVDLDDSPVSQSVKGSRLVERSPLFEPFVDKILQKLSESGRHLTSFRLHLGGKTTNHSHVLDKRDESDATTCFSNVEPVRLNVWISYPLAHCGLRELDLSFHVRNPYDCKLPVGLFSCQSLEVLRLDSNLEIDDGVDIQRICLPNLKLLHLRSFVFTEDDFVTSLVSSCPALKDLSITDCWWNILDRLIISSLSLLRLVLIVQSSLLDDEDDKYDDVVFIDTPNLQYLQYTDYLASHYSIAHMNALAEAHIRIGTQLDYETYDGDESCFWNQLSLVRVFYNVQHLSLLGYCAENVYFSRELEDVLPTFLNLRTLELDSFFHARWDIVLSLFLRRSPVLETLIFPKGLCVDNDGVFVSPSPDDVKVAAEEAKAWRTNETIPSGCVSHLKRIELNSCYVRKREINTIRFFLREASVLKELVIRLYKGFDPIVLQRELEWAPKASNSCSITVQS